ncbi:hypothetical protein V6N11_076412 [Hibiscus sabdariffa]|uniref:Obg domain-containing protein n=1 Tax=Hibiscus sabdariffa TaxID=183260 RepID=A0ABR2Q6P5_9ROSI
MNKIVKTDEGTGDFGLYHERNQNMSFIQGGGGNGTNMVFLGDEGGAGDDAKLSEKEGVKFNGEVLCSMVNACLEISKALPLQGDNLITELLMPFPMVIKSVIILFHHNGCYCDQL